MKKKQRFIRTLASVVALMLIITLTAANASYSGYEYAGVIRLPVVWQLQIAPIIVSWSITAMNRGFPSTSLKMDILE